MAQIVCTVGGQKPTPHHVLLKESYCGSVWAAIEGTGEIEVSFDCEPELKSLPWKMERVGFDGLREVSFYRLAAHKEEDK